MRLSPSRTVSFGTNKNQPAFRQPDDAIFDYYAVVLRNLRLAVSVFSRRPQSIKNVEQAYYARGSAYSLRLRGNQIAYVLNSSYSIRKLCAPVSAFPFVSSSIMYLSVRESLFSDIMRRRLGIFDFEASITSENPVMSDFQVFNTCALALRPSCSRCYPFPFS